MIDNGYIEVTINGKTTGLKFNMYAAEQYNSVKGRDSYVRNYTAIVYVGLLGNAYAKQTEPPFTFEEISDWVDEQILSDDKDGVLNRISEVFMHSSIIVGLDNKRKNGEPSEESKKKILQAE